MSADWSSCLEESEHGPATELEALGSAPVGIAVTSLAGSLLYANEAFGRFFDVDAAAQRGGDICQITRGQLREEFLTMIARGGGAQQICVPVAEDRLLLCTGKRVMHGALPIYLTIAVQDISDLALEHAERWRLMRELLGGFGIGGAWSWTMRIGSVERIGSNHMEWIGSSEELFGAGLQPRTFNELMLRISPHCRERVAAEIARAARSRSSYTVDYELVGRDGATRSMRSLGRYVEGVQCGGRLIGVELEFEPLPTKAHREGVCQTLLEHMDVPVAWIDRGLRYRYFNPAFAALLGSTADDAPEVDQRVLNTVLDPARRRRLADVLTRVMKGEPSIFEREFVDERGVVQQWVDFHINPIRGESGEIDGAIAVGYDVSPLKRANLHHQSINVKFRQRFEHRVAKIDAANRDLSNRVAIACDGLRARVQEIRAATGAAAASNTAGVRQVLGALGNMEALIEDLDRLSSVGLRRPAWRRIDVNRLVREVLGDLEFMLEGRSVEFDIGTLPHVVADRTLLKQVFQNLLSNAIKFTGGGAARIRVWAAVEEDTTVWSVADNGMGFDAKEADELFSAFVRRGTKPRGTGLSVAWRAIEQLNGRLWCESSPGQGATFHFTIGGEEYGV
jgi:PAS domain S-box-containing protein